jgi:sugar O-acyltransferase (sialic acid O-acetyltransferase NeuD family)
MNISNKPVLILGAGGHAKVVADALIQTGNEILGFLTPDKIPGSKFFRYGILGDDSVVDKYSPDNVVLANGIGSLPHQHLRWSLAAKMRQKGFTFLTVIHPSTIIANDVRLDEGVQIMAGVVIQPSSHIGKDTIINTGVMIDHDCKVGENCHIAPGVVCSGKVYIASNSHLGTGTAVIQDVSIGENCVIAAGSVIYKDIPSHMKYIQTMQKQLL